MYGIAVAHHLETARCILVDTVIISGLSPLAMIIIQNIHTFCSRDEQHVKRQVCSCCRLLDGYTGSLGDMVSLASLMPLVTSQSTVTSPVTGVVISSCI
jgi:hypothetical protein